MLRRSAEVLVLGVLLWDVIGAGEASETKFEVNGTIAFSAVGRVHYGFDVFALRLPESWASAGPGGLQKEDLEETRLTDGVSINYNGHFVEGAQRLVLDAFLREDGFKSRNCFKAGSGTEGFIFVSERSGDPSIHFNCTRFLQNPHRRTRGKPDMSRAGVRSMAGTDEKTNMEKEIVPFPPDYVKNPFMIDRPSVGGNRIVFTSTAEASGTPNVGWTAVYSTSLLRRKTTRLTPVGVAEYSPALSPSGEWVMAASSGKEPQLDDTLKTDLYAYRASDGTGRRRVVQSGGWPTWLDERTIFFHRLADDGWWSIYRVHLPANFLSSGEGEVLDPERITPPGVHAITPAASRSGNWLVVATRRPEFLKHVRHVEIFDLISKRFIKLTELMSPNVSHYNPFISSNIIGYHRCRGSGLVAEVVPTVELLQSHLPNLSLLRVDGTFPSFSPDGSHLAFVRDSADSALVVPVKAKGVYVINLIGRILQRKIFGGRAFGIAWDPVRTGVLYLTAGKCLEDASEELSIISIGNIFAKGQELSSKQLTKDGTGNNGMPSPSPDGKLLVFRSGRSGYKNLYIMDAIRGEEKMIRRLTEGNWTDQHPVWSGDGVWILFISNRESPESNHYDIYMVHPDGTGLHKILANGAVKNAHPYLVNNDKYVVFSSDFAGYTAEPISVPLHFIPQGEVFLAHINDSSSMQRLTHNPYEDGSASWTSIHLTSLELDELSSSGLAQPLKCNNPDYYSNVWPTITGHEDVSCAYASQVSALHTRSHSEL